MSVFRGANLPQGASCNVERHSMSDWQTQDDKLLADYEGITRERYTAGLASFRTWYAQSYNDEPDAALLTDDEVRDILDPKDVHGPDFLDETLRVLKEKEERTHGEYRTRWLKLKA
jgi:hypothetical protein